MKEIIAKNLSAQLNYKATGNPPGTLPYSSISNCYPGLEFDFRAVWKHLFGGVELHECGLTDRGHIVLHVDKDSNAYQDGVRDLDLLVSVDGVRVVASVSGPGAPLEFSNALADVINRAGSEVPCVFVSSDNGESILTKLFVHPVLSEGTISQELAPPGRLTQGLCSPWQADYRECGCYYWAASRPDFVNAEPEGTDGVTGNAWMQRDYDVRNRPDARPYPNAEVPDRTHFTYQELYTEWQSKLSFVRKGRTES